MAPLTRRELLKTTGAAAATVAIYPLVGPTVARAQTIAWNHDPASPIGPNHWGDIGFPICGQGMSQSPVDIVTGSVATSHGSPALLRYETSELGVENTGHVVEVMIPAGVKSTLQINGDRFDLVQYHFHAPAEHSVDGGLADVEAHLVHMNAQGVTAVVGVFFRIGAQPNALLETILGAAPMTAGDEVHAGEANPAELLRGVNGVKTTGAGHAQVSSFYSYDGSLTTPGCTQDVRWFVLAQGGTVSSAAVTRFHQTISLFPDYNGYPNNNRPVQPLNGRVIGLRAG